MFYDICTLAIWEALALALGLIVGWVTFSSAEPGRWFAGWLRIALIVFVVGLFLAIIKVIPGRAGFWLEAALLLFAAYLIGCWFGGGLRGLFAPPKEAGKPVAAAAPAVAAGESAKTETVAPAQVAAEPAKVETAASEAATPATSESVGAEAVAVAEPVVAEVAAEPANVEAAASEAAAPVDETVVTHAAAVAAPVVAEVVAEPAEAEAAADDLGPEPERIAKVEGEEKHEGQRPVGFVAPRGGVPDDLQRIKGIGPQNEGRLHALGIWHFSQITGWTRENVHWVGSYLSFPGRIDRERWIEQATELAAGRATGTHKRARADGSAGQDNVADLTQVKPHG